MFIKENIKTVLPFQNFNDVYVVADFDRTITKGNSQTSWSILAKSNLLPSSYVKERQELYEKYRPIELDETLEPSIKSNLIKEWFQKHIELFSKYQLNEELFEKAATDLRIMEFRPKAKEFIEFLHENNIPLIIISAGIGNFIESFLKHHNCYFNNIYVSSNKILFKDGIACGVDKNIIHSLNKNEVSLPTEISKKLQGRNNVVLLGDQISDLKMVDTNAHDCVVSICFIPDDCKEKLELLKSNFDIVCEKSDDYDIVKNLLFKKS